MAEKRELKVVVVGDASSGQRALKGLGDTAARTADRAQSGAERWAAGLNRTGTAMAATGATMSKRLSVPVALFGGLALKTAGDFEAGMNRVGALSGATGAELEAMSNQAKELGSTTQFSASEAADAMGFLSQAGFDANETMEALPSTLQLAAAAGLDLGSAADITSNILSGYGLKVEELGKTNDVLTKAFTSANMDLSMLGESMKYVGPIASGAGVQFEETAAAIGLLGNAGIQGSMAGTSLRQAIGALINPTKQQAQVIEELGLKTMDSQGNMLPLVDIIKQLETSGASTADIMSLFGQRAGPAMSALVSEGSGALADLTGKLENSGGTAQRIADSQMKGLNGALKELKSAFEGAMIALAETGALETATNALRKVANVVQRFSQANPQLMRFVVILGLVVIAAGPLLFVMGKLFVAAGQVVTGFAKIIPAAVRVAAAFRTAIVAVSQFVARVVLATARFVVSMAMMAARAAVAGARIAAQFALMAARAMVAAGRHAVAAARIVAGWVLMGVQAMIHAARMAAAWFIALGPVGWVIATVIALVALIIANWSKVKKYTAAAWNWIVGKVKAAWSALKGAVSAALGWVVGKVVSGWNRVKAFTSRAWNGIKALISVAMSVLRSRISSGMSAVQGAMSRVWNSIKAKASSVWNGIKAMLSSFVGYVQGIPGRISGALSGMWSGLKSGFRGAINGVIGMWNRLSFSVPSVKIFGKTLGGGTISTPNIPYMATGGTIASGGSAVVGEAGPELISLPRGAQVTPLSGGDRSRVLGGGGVVVNVRIEGNVTAERDLARAIAGEVRTALKREDMRNGR